MIHHLPKREMPRQTVYVTQNEVCAVGYIHIAGFQEPLKITINGLKDMRTGFYRNFSMRVEDAPGMNARLTRAIDPKKIERIILPP